MTGRVEAPDQRLVDAIREALKASSSSGTTNAAKDDLVAERIAAALVDVVTGNDDLEQVGLLYDPEQFVSIAFVLAELGEPPLEPGEVFDTGDAVPVFRLVGGS